MTSTAPTLPRRQSAHVALRAWPILLAFSCLGCTSLPIPDLSFSLESNSTRPEIDQPVTVTPQGPGSVFATVPAAAMDALAYSYLETRRVVYSARSARGGAIFPVDGGFSYDEPEAARPGTGDLLRYRLRPTDVAHFRHYPARGIGGSDGSNGSNRSVYSEIERFVERRDPAKRPIYYLTPERYVRVFTGADVGVETLARVDRGTRRGATELAIRSETSLASVAMPDQPLALQPTPGSTPPR